MNVEEMYQQIILDHYKEKHHSGLRDGYAAEVSQVNPSCGDELKLRLHLDGDTITDVSYDSVGCSISQASTSVMTDLVIGKTAEQAQQLVRATRYAPEGVRGMGSALARSSRRRTPSSCPASGSGSTVSPAWCMTTGTSP